jgi:diguanylate cyclase (GGDEF)-like protein
MRGLQRLAVLGGIALVLLAVVAGGWNVRQQARSDPGHRLATEAAEREEALEDYFERTRTITLLTAQNSTIADFYAAPGTRQAKIAAGGPLVDRLNDMLAYVGQLNRGRIGEASLTDRDGAEVARVVGGSPTSPAQLSRDESRDAFFAPTLAMKPGQVYQARPHVSQDTGEWVISSSTRAPTGAGSYDAILHFEITVESIRKTLISSNPAVTTWIVDAKTDQVLIDSRYPQRIGAPLGRPDDRSLRDLVMHPPASGAVTRAGTRLVLRHPELEAGNANDWVIVVSTPVAGSLWSSLFSVSTLGPLFAGLALLALASAGYRASQRELLFAARHDALTGLPNRTQLHEGVARALKDAEREGTSVGLLLIDLDGFKEVNDGVGHHYGDLLLRLVARRLTAVVGDTGTVARLGGDEFAVLLPRAGEHAAREVGVRMQAALRMPCTVEQVSLEVEASIGVALYPQHAANSDELLQRADIAMYVAKQLHSGVAIFDPAADHDSRRRLSLLGTLRPAIDEGQLLVHYQPKADLATGMIHGAEALVRWRHPDHGFLLPGEFIPVTEGTELIKPLTRHVLRIALAQCQDWHRAGQDLSVAVNIAARVVLDERFPEEVAQQLEASGMPARQLVLEITESALLADPGRARKVLLDLYRMGVQLSLDDFGTGYSSLAHLKDLPIHELKIDRSFVTQMTRDPDDAVIVAATITLGKSLGMRVVAEGVEDLDTWEELVRLGCDAAQGYHIGRPMSAADLSVLLGTGNARLIAGTG